VALAHLLSGLAGANAFIARSPVLWALGGLSVATLLGANADPMLPPELRKTWVECGLLANVRA
jgi:hypothetical protein